MGCPDHSGAPQAFEPYEPKTRIYDRRSTFIGGGSPDEGYGGYRRRILLS